MERRHRVGLRSPIQTLQDHQVECVLVHGYASRLSRQIVRAARAQSLGTVIRGPFTSLERPGTSVAHRIVRRIVLKRFLAQFSSVCFVGRAAREELLSLGVPNRRMFESPYSVDSRYFTDMARSADKTDARRMLGLAEHDFVVLVVGRLAEHKSPEVVLRALERISDRSGLVTVFVGTGPQEDELRRRAMKITGADVRFTGFVNQGELANYYGSADLLVFPSQHETWGLVLNEGLYFGLPAVVSSGVSAAMDLVKHGETGFVFDRGDFDELARNIETLRRRPDLCRRFGHAGRELVAGYSIERSAEGVVRAVEYAADPSAEDKVRGSAVSEGGMHAS